MPSLLGDFLQSPEIGFAAGLLTPTRNSAFGPALLQGLQAANIQRQANQTNAISRLAIDKARQDAERRKKRDLIAQGIRSGQIPMQQGLIALASLSNDPAAAFSRLIPQAEATPNIVKVAQAIGLQQGTQEFNQFVRENTGQSQTVVNVGGDLPFKVPANFQLKDPNNPAAGVMPIPGGPASRKSPEEAAKTAMVANALELMPQIRRAIIKDDGIDRALVATMNANIPFSEGRIVRAQVKDTLEAKLRAETGAAAPDPEVERLLVRFMPSSLDSDAGITDKLNRLEKFLNTALEISDPELFKRLSKNDNTTTYVETKSINGRVFSKDSTGQWFEVTSDGR